MSGKVLVVFSLVSIFQTSFVWQEGEVGRESLQPRYQIQAYSTLHELRVVDREGNSVKGLTEKSFLVLESGEQRPIQYFEEMESSPVSLGILVDIGSSSNEEQILVAKAAIFELVHLLDQTDEVLIGVYDTDIHFLSDLTKERLELLRAIENISPGGRINFFSKLAHVFASSAHTGWAIDKTLMRIKNCDHANKILVVFSAAFGSIGPATMEHLQLGGTKLFAVTWKNRAGDALNFWGDKTASKRVISGSGGIAFRGQTILERIEVLRESLESYYLIAYRPLDIASKEEAEVEIQIPNHPEYRIHAVRRVATDHWVY